jgi:type IV pilus assembly protein PilV
MTARALTRVRRSRGATMVEVLVALFVLSVGLLGVAAMQQVGLRNGYTAQLRGQATALATDIIDRMRANRARALAGDYTVAYGAAGDPTELCPASGSVDQVSCDVAEWGAALRAQLPSGEGRVERVVNGDGTQRVRVSIRWREGRGRDPDVGDPEDFIVFQTETQL